MTETPEQRVAPLLRLTPALFHGQLWLPAQNVPDIMRGLANAMETLPEAPAESWINALRVQADTIDLMLMQQLTEHSEATTVSGTLPPFSGKTSHDL